MYHDNPKNQGIQNILWLIVIVFVFLIKLLFNLFNNKQMKSTKLMLAVIATILITWCVMGLIGYLISDLSFKECLTNDGTLYVMLILGWVPAIFVASDVHDLDS